MNTVRIAATVGGLTTVTTAYTIGDQMGTETTLTGIARVAGLGGTIMSVTAVDDSAVLGAFDIYLFNAASTPAADNAAATWTDANMDTMLVGIINMPATVVQGANSACTLNNIGMAYDSVTANLFCNLVARTANAVFAGGATSIKLAFKVYQD